MHLLLDIGNARIKWAYADAGELLDEGAFVHRGLLEPTQTPLVPAELGQQASTLLLSVLSLQTNTRTSATPD